VAALEPTDVALLGTQRERDLILRQAVGAPQNAKLLSKDSDRLAPRLIAALDVVDGLAFPPGVDLKKLAAFEQAPNAVVCSFLGHRSRILTIASYGHLSSATHRRRFRRRLGKNAVIGQTVDPYVCQRHTIFRGFPSAAHPILT
jgi:hypothetical protein